MSRDLDALFDECIDRMNGGESLDDCLASFPEHAAKLEPLLRAVCGIQDTCSIIPSASAKSAGRLQLDAALAGRKRELRRLQRKPRLPFGWPRAWAALAVVLVLSLLGFGLHLMVTPGEPPIVAHSNFRMLLSHEANAIGNFTSRHVTRTGIGLLRRG